jgi:colicin import membrane protein
VSSVELFCAEPCYGRIAASFQRDFPIMAIKLLKVFRAHMGFYDTVVAAPSQKAALEAWGAGKNQFAKGFAKATNDPVAVESALADPGVVLRRPFGSGGPFKREADRVSAPKVSPRQNREAKERRKKAAMAARKAAARELREAEAEAKLARAEIRKREAEFAREKAAAERQARKRIARAVARLKQ